MTSTYNEYFSYNDFVTSTKLTYVPSFQFLISKSKSLIEERISIIMSSVGVSIFGYKIIEDEYWGKINNNNKTITITINLIKLTEKETKCVISIFNTNTNQSKKISKTIFEKITHLETSRLIYKNFKNDNHEEKIEMLFIN